MSALPVSSSAGYVGLLRWAFAERFRWVLPSQQRAMLSQAEKLASPWFERELYCGFEVHHDGSDRVDVSFDCKASDIDAAAAPTWWPAWLRTDEQATLLRFRDRHWLEFDQRDEDRQQLAGLFQHCETAAPHDERAFTQLLQHFHAIGCFAPNDVRQSGALRRFFELFGVPFQVGVMVGRPEGVKLVAKLDGIDELALREFLERERLSSGARLPGDLGRPPPDTHLAISLDVSLTDDRFSPTFGVELTGPGRATAFSAWHGVEPFIVGLGIDADQLLSLRDTLRHLPYGQREQTSYLGLDDVQHSVDRLASINHLKLVFREGRQTTVKSYLSLREVKGAPIDHP